MQVESVNQNGPELLVRTFANRHYFEAGESAAILAFYETVRHDMTDTDLQRRLDSAEEAIALLLAHGNVRPSELLARFPNSYTKHKVILPKAEALWVEIHPEDEGK